MLEVRTQCVNSPLIDSVKIGGRLIDNCAYESRLSLKNLTNPLTPEQSEILSDVLKALPESDSMTQLMSLRFPIVSVEVDLNANQVIEVAPGRLLIGRYWLNDSQQTARALVMAALKRNEISAFHLEVITDFLMMSVFKQDNWSGHSMQKEVRFPTSSSSFAQYCLSPFRSLSKLEDCLGRQPASGQTLDGDFVENDIWIHEALLAAALARVFAKLDLQGQLQMLKKSVTMNQLPTLLPLMDTTIEARVLWIRDTLNAYLDSIHIAPTAGLDLALKRTYVEMELQTPTHWELTVDITHTPAWREILEQFKSWTKLRPKQRVLVFTPEGSIALPAGLPVRWANNEIQSQKHVMIACQWPKPHEAINISARQMFTEQTCDKVKREFWN
jgi:hypothetical protein